MVTTACARVHRAPRSRWRLALLITVLAGFFLMHGLSSADICAGAADSPPSAAQSTAALPSTTTVVSPAATGKDAPSQASSADRCCAAMGALCVPQRPQEPVWLLIMLLFGLAVLPFAKPTANLLDAVTRNLRSRWRLSGAIAPVRLLACVSRT